MIYGDSVIYADNERVNDPDPSAIRQCNNLYGYTLNNPLIYVDLYGSMNRDCI
jgi:hypothetical protein